MNEETMPQKVHLKSFCLDRALSISSIESTAESVVYKAKKFEEYLQESEKK